MYKYKIKKIFPFSPEIQSVVKIYSRAIKTLEGGDGDFYRHYNEFIHQFGGSSHLNDKSSNP